MQVINKMAALVAAAGFAGKAMDDLKKSSDAFENLYGGRRSSRAYKNVKKVSKKLTRAKNKLARASRRKNRK